MNLKQLATDFLNAYYNTMMTNRAQLVNYYRENSQMSYEGDLQVGLKQISEKIESLGFQTIQYQFESFDFQQTIFQNSILIVVNGVLNMDNQNTFKFYETFLLTQDQAGGFFVLNDLFKLIIE